MESGKEKRKTVWRKLYWKWLWGKMATGGDGE